MSESDFTTTRRAHLLSLAALPLMTLSVSPTSAQQQSSRSTPTPAPQQPSRAPVGRTSPRIALVLGSGSARGFAHIGVIKALEAAGIKPDLIVGTSAGALVGAFYASGYTPMQMEELAIKVKDIDIVDLNAGSKRGMVIGDTMQSFINRATRDKLIEQLSIPFIAIATQLRTGELATFRRGDLGLAVRASCSVPGVFIPPKIDNIEYVDGALVSPVPVRVAREAGADFVIAVDVSSAPLNSSPVGIYEQVMHSFEVMGRSLAKLEAEQADVIIRPDVGRIPSTDFNARAAFIQIGQTAGTRYAPVIREKLLQWRSSAGNTATQHRSPTSR